MTLGSIVFYRLSAADAAAINRRRSDAAEYLRFRKDHDGKTVHVGNPVAEGQVYPMMIVKLLPASAANGQVHLDGNDLYWVTGVRHGEHCGEWLTTETSA